MIFTIVGVIFLIAAVVVHLVLRISPFTYPLGILLLGVGLLIAMVFNPRRLAVITWLALFLGLEVFLLYKNLKWSEIAGGLNGDPIDASKAKA